MKNWVSNKHRNKPGFTLVELLIVIVVVSILAAISIVAYRGVQERARDTIRLADADAITKALKVYQVRKGAFFNPASANGSWEASNEDTPEEFLTPLVEEKILDKVPVDPVNQPGVSWYAYYRYPAGTSGCDSSKGAFYVFGIKDLETSGRPSPDSPGWSCPSRDWETEFDWVTGGFER